MEQMFEAVVEQLVNQNETDSSTRHVTGTVVHTDGSAIRGLMIQAYHRRVGGDSPLGVEVVTDDAGRYKIIYEMLPGLSKVDLFVRAFHEQAVVATSTIVIGARQQETLNLTLSERKFRGPPEFATVSGILRPLVDSSDANTLDADDVALLVLNTGIARENVTAWIAARHLSDRTKLDHESLYGLVRTNGTASLPHLMRRSVKQLHRSLTNAAESNVISLSAAQHAHETATKLHQLAVKLSASRETPASLGALLGTSKQTSPAQQQAFIARYAQHEGPIHALWGALRQDPKFGDAVVDDLQLSLQLGTIAANHPPLVTALRASGVQRASQVAVLDRESWQKLLQTSVGGKPVGAPRNIAGATQAERETNYITLLQERSARAFPTPHVAKALKAVPEWQASTAVAFLDLHPDFDLLNRSVPSALNDSDVTLLPTWDRAQLEEQLNTVQRVARIAPRGQEEPVVNGLLSKGYTSALSISRHSRSSFRRRMSDTLGDTSLADSIHRNAQYHVARATNAYALMHPFVGGGQINAIVGDGSALKDNPTWASLFGNVDYCSCMHCRSLYSPAAYLVDLLAWLDGHLLENGASNEETALDRLLTRRPDIQRIELSCENTNTVLPYVDLVNEILEVRVLSPSGGTSTSVPLVPQASTATSPELLAAPEYLNTQAYDNYLALAVSPVLLPFDLWTELGHVYFEHLGVGRSDLMEALRRGNVPRRDAIDAERLRLSTLQLRILTGVSRHEVWELWGYRSEMPLGIDFKVGLSKVSHFLQRADIEYEQLLDLLHCRFVNDGSIRVSGALDNTDEMTLSLTSNEALGHMQRFLRLWRNRGISMLDLDKALHALGVAEIDAGALAKLADLDRVQALTRAPMLEALSWWATIDTFVDRPEKETPVPSLYERVYLNRAVTVDAQELAFPFALNAAGAGLANIVAWNDVRSLLQAALSIDADELALLLDETVDNEPNEQRVVTGETATLEGLSALYRHVSFARRLGLTVGELQGLLRLTGIDPFDVADTGATVAFLKAVLEARASDFSLTELHYLLEHDAQAETSVGVTDETIGQTLVEIRDALARIAADYTAVADPVGAVTAKYLAQILSADAVAEVMETLQTPADASNHLALETVLTGHLASFRVFDAARLIALDVERRFNAMAAILAPYLRQAQSDAVIIEKIATFADRDLDSVEDILAARLRMSVDGQSLFALRGLRESPYTTSIQSELVVTDDPEAFATLRRLSKAAVVLRTLDIDIDMQHWLFDVGIHNGLLNPLALPVEPQAVPLRAWEAWTNLTRLARLSQDLPGGEPSVVALLQLLEVGGDLVVAEDAFLTQLTARTGWLREDIDSLKSAFAPAFPADWRDGGMLRTFVDVFALIGRLGVSAAQADTWATGSIRATQVEELRLACKSKHDEERWPAIARALRDPVRAKQRDALVAYLIARDDAYTSTEELFSDLLIDCEMEPCMLTSRIKQAISSVQLLVQRSFLNLEEDVALTREDREQWEWMKNYRVWEAARKVFLYPENWIEPELRLDKSPLFEQLENSLLQGELDDVAAEKAYTAYLEGLLKIARLEVMGLYHESEVDADGTVNTLHVVARTRSAPHEYYYRQWVDEREWTAWEGLDVEIDGDHLVVAVHDRRLYLFWPVIEQKILVHESSSEPTDYYEMRLAWVERLHDEWSAGKQSTGFITVDDAVWSETESSVYFRLADTEALAIDCLRGTGTGVAELGRFIVDSCTGDVLGSPRSGTRPADIPIGMGFSRMRFASQYLSVLIDGAYYTTPVSISAARRDAEGDIVSGPEDIVMLTPADPSQIHDISYVYPSQYRVFDSQHGVFLDDEDRTYHVMPETIIGLDKYSKSDEVDPYHVGMTYSEHVLFEALPAAQIYEPEIDWTYVPAAGLLGVGSIARAPTEPLQDDARALEALAGTLTVGALQQSQKIFEQAAQSADPYISLGTTTGYRFTLFYHPYVCDFMTELRRLGVEGLLDPNPEGSEPRLVRQAKSRLDFFTQNYDVTDAVLQSYPIQTIDFETGGAYAKYNWEIFFHAPMLIACRLSHNQRFEDARRWFHFMFDPTHRSDEADPLRFWKIQPFYREADAPIDQFLELAASVSTSPEVTKAREAYDDQVAAWLQDPFNPHELAELRTTAYQKALVMKYLNNLISWGDQLFRQDTIESINEATQLYVLALSLLGERPDALPPRSVPVPKTFEQVRSELSSSVLNNPLVLVENLMFRATAPTAPFSAPTATASPWMSLIFPASSGGGSTTTTGFYFCIPPNEQLLGYWDTVEDRLFKIRNCMNIEGVVRQLPLFEPPIDPGMLVRARAAGIDLSSALTDLSAPLPHYRFATMLLKTYSLNQSVRTLGSSLLSTLEKHDAEALAILRANQEVAVLDAIQAVKELGVAEAKLSLDAAKKSLAVVEARATYYETLADEGWLLAERQAMSAELDQLAKLGLTEKKLNTASTLSKPVKKSTSNLQDLTVSVSVGWGPVSGSMSKGIINTLINPAMDQLEAQSAQAAGAAFAARGNISATTASFGRRNQEWRQQGVIARKEQNQIVKQIEAAEIRVALAERELTNHERQIENARSVRELMEQKFTNVELYQWMLGQLSSLYFQSYQLAYDLAKQTERAYQHELALPSATFIQFGYWDSLRKGLLAGERLQYDLERMDKAYVENNVREYEITRHISLSLLDPVALLQLQTAGACEFSIPEAWFDLDYPGQYLRRIKSVGVTVPCVAGPYTGVPMRLTLVSSRTRIDPSAAGSYPMSEEDVRFQQERGITQSIVISGGREDAGIFSDPRDERYLPFEGRGAIGDWSLKLTSAVPTFDWTSMTDVVLHIHYTAREGGDLLRDAALESLNAELAGLPLRRTFSARSEFPSEWNAFLRPAEGSSTATLRVDLAERLFPHIAQNAGLKIAHLEIVTLVNEPEEWNGAEVDVVTAADTQHATLAGSTLLYAGQPSASIAYGSGAAPGLWEVTLNIAQLGTPADWAQDMVLIATYELELPLTEGT